VTTVASALERPLPRAPRPVLVAIAAAWVLAVAADRTGTGTSLHHHSQIEGGPPLWAALVLFLLAWQAMVAAMMLPSSLPLIRLFEAVSGTQHRAWQARGAFLGGYTAVWTAFGALAFLGAVAVYRLVDAVPWLSERRWLIAGSVLAIAGAFQFSDLKERCLTKCRLPGPYLLAHYRRGRGAAFRLGSGHGLFCLGCCWALMLLMFVVGIAHLELMAVLTALMVYEKIGRHGQGIARLSGVVLLVWAAAVLAQPRWLPAAFALDARPEAAAASAGGVERAGPGPVQSVVVRRGYRIELRLRPNRPGVPNELAVLLTRAGVAVREAEVAASFTMLDMEMGERRYQLSEVRPGVYRASDAVLAMAGDWGIGVDVSPPGEAPVALLLVDSARG
jgi:predicted metal-binding membrane protein